MMEQENSQPEKSPSLLGVMGSVLAGMFGVQSDKNRREDFATGKPSRFIIVGLLMTILFVLMLWGVVSLVIYLSGA